jgi:murein DD-endopeptidase MepM/ murein hydrolase activator NlpD
MGREGERRRDVARPHPQRRDLRWDRLSPKRGEIVELRPRGPLAERLERERRVRIERARTERDRAIRERIEGRRRERLAALRRERAAGRVQPRVEGPVRKRARAAENRRRAAARRHGLFWPTAKAGLAVTVVLGVSAALAAAFGLPLPAVGPQGGTQSLANSAAVFALDPGTPAGLSPGYVFPLRGPHDFGTAIDRFGAPRSGHVHEGQDIFGKVGTPEVAVHDGVVVDRGKNTDPDSGGRGNFLAIYSPRDDRSFVYMHMLKPPPVGVGQHVHAGEVVGQLGCSGECDGPHLHFEVRIGRASAGADTKAIDPLPYLRQWPQATP